MQGVATPFKGTVRTVLPPASLRFRLPVYVMVFGPVSTVQVGKKLTRKPSLAPGDMVIGVVGETKKVGFVRCITGLVVTGPRLGVMVTDPVPCSRPMKLVLGAGKLCL